MCRWKFDDVIIKVFEVAVARTARPTVDGKSDFNHY